MYESPHIRVKEYPQGWLSEIRKPHWTIFGIRYKWTHFISYTGIPERPFYFSTMEAAVFETILVIEKQMYGECVE